MVRPMDARGWRAVVAALVLAAWWPVGARQPAAPGGPTLLVLVVVDQMRAEYQTRSCTADRSVRAIAYGGTRDREGHSPEQLRVPTLAERLRARWPESRSVSMSELAKATSIPAPLLAAVRASHVPGRSGDITIVPAPNWILVPGNDAAGGDATTHGSPHPYDRHVPLVFLGTAFTPGRYQAPASPADAAPTLAATVDLPFTGVEGRPLTASARPPRPSQ